MKRQYIIVDPFTHRPYLAENKADALERAVKLNKQSHNHPAYILYRTDMEGRGIYMATLSRAFGTEDFSWSPER